jgi:hypothetical protein
VKPAPKRGYLQLGFLLGLQLQHAFALGASFRVELLHQRSQQLAEAAIAQ